MRFLWLPLICCVASGLTIAPACAEGGFGEATIHSDQGGPGIKPGEPTDPEAPDSHLKPPLGNLQLTDADRQEIRKAIAAENNQVTFELPETKAAKDFEPKVGLQLPPHVVAHAFPSDLTQKLPKLADYKYVKMKGQVLIVNDLTKDIVDMFPEA